MNRPLDPGNYADLASGDELAELWRTLSSQNAKEARTAIWRLTYASKSSLPFLKVRTDFTARIGLRQHRAKTLLATVPATAWHRLSCGVGSKSPRLYDWAVTLVNSLEPHRYARWLLIRRSVSDPTEVAYFACGGPPQTTLEDLVRVAGARWSIEKCFELAKGDCGLDEYEVRSWRGWHRHTVLSLFALAVVAVIRSRVNRPRRRKKGET